MKKKIVFVLLIILIIIGTVVIIINKNCIGVAKGSISSDNKLTSACTFEFKAVENQSIKFKFDSTIKEGTLTFKIFNSDNLVIKEFPVNKDGGETIIMPSSGMYTAKAEYTDFVGDFKLKAYNNE